MLVSTCQDVDLVDVAVAGYDPSRLDAVDATDLLLECDRVHRTVSVDPWRLERYDQFELSALWPGT